MARKRAGYAVLALLAGLLGGLAAVSEQAAAQGAGGNSLVVSPDALKAPTIGWHTALNGNRITVRLEDEGGHYRVERVELLGPGGVRIVAGDVTRQVEHSSGFASNGGTGDETQMMRGGATGAGGTAGVVIRSNPDHSGANYDTVKLAVTRAHVTLPDPELFKRDPTAWKFRVQLLDDTGKVTVSEFPAPEPQ